MENKKTDLVKKDNESKVIGSVNEEQDYQQMTETEAQNRIIERLEKVIKFVKDFPISNEETLDHIEKPLGDLEASLKNIPNGPFFNDVFPKEIKKYILGFSYPCDYKAFIAAAVCQEWKNILGSRFKDKEVIIGEKCSKCEDNDCVNPKEMLQAEVVHKIDSHLVISKPLTDLDSKFIAEALTSVSKFNIINSSNYDDPPLSDDQLEHLFGMIEKEDKVMEEVKLVHLNLQGLNQERVANCFTNKVKRLTLGQGHPEYLGVPILDIKTFLRKLQDPANIKLTHLMVEGFDFFEDEYEYKYGVDNVVNALVNVENVKLSGQPLSKIFTFKTKILERLMKMIVQSSTIMKTLILGTGHHRDGVYNFISLISSGDLKTILIKMTNLRVNGIFSEDQLKALNIKRELKRGVKGFAYLLRKGSSEML